MAGLTWVGGEGQFLPGIPARDLTADEAERYDAARLLASGLYSEQTSKRKPPPGAEFMPDEGEE